MPNTLLPSVDTAWSSARSDDTGAFENLIWLFGAQPGFFQVEGKELTSLSNSIDFNESPLRLNKRSRLGRFNVSSVTLQKESTKVADFVGKKQTNLFSDVQVLPKCP